MTEKKSTIVKKNDIRFHISNLLNQNQSKEYNQGLIDLAYLILEPDSNESIDDILKHQYNYKKKTDKGLCHFRFCDRPRVYKNYCKSHHRQKLKGQRLTDLGPRKNATLEEKLEYYSVPVTECGCIVWTGYFNETSGYGVINVKGQSKLAHRVSWEISYGPAPKSKVVDHICGNRLCINADHLRLATKAENSQHRTRLGSNNTSGHRNVYRNKNGSWYVSIKHKGTHNHFGTYSSIEEAQTVAKSKRKELFGEFA